MGLGILVTLWGWTLQGCFGVGLGLGTPVGLGIPRHSRVGHSRDILGLGTLGHSTDNLGLGT